jgi:2-pyrone-4,6-dicarboxylate lactonase
VTHELVRNAICDCHSHVYGPYDRFPLAASRTFDPPESPVEPLEDVWKGCSIARAVLIQGSAHGTDHRALLDAISRDPERRRGVAILPYGISDEELIHLHQSGIRAMRLNWVLHLLKATNPPESEMLKSAEALMRRVEPLGWHVEVHVDPECLDLVARLEVSNCQRIVIDHMARVDAGLGIIQPAFGRLRRLLDRKNIWVKVSGADRLARSCTSLLDVVPFISALVQQAPDKCVWGFDWPHVNLNLKREDAELFNLLSDAMPDETMRAMVLCDNPAHLYGFDSTDQSIPVIEYAQGGSAA